MNRGIAHWVIVDSFCRAVAAFKWANKEAAEQQLEKMKKDFPQNGYHMVIVKDKGNGIPIDQSPPEERVTVAKTGFSNKALRYNALQVEAVRREQFNKMLLR